MEEVKESVTVSVTLSDLETDDEPGKPDKKEETVIKQVQELEKHVERQEKEIEEDLQEEKEEIRQLSDVEHQRNVQLLDKLDEKLQERRQVEHVKVTLHSFSLY